MRTRLAHEARTRSMPAHMRTRLVPWASTRSIPRLFGCPRCITTLVALPARPPATVRPTLGQPRPQCRRRTAHHGACRAPLPPVQRLGHPGPTVMSRHGSRSRSEGAPPIPSVPRRGPPLPVMQDCPCSPLAARRRSLRSTRTARSGSPPRPTTVPAQPRPPGTAVLRSDGHACSAVAAQAHHGACPALSAWHRHTMLGRPCPPACALGVQLVFWCNPSWTLGP